MRSLKIELFKCSLKRSRIPIDPVAVDVPFLPSISVADGKIYMKIMYYDNAKPAL
jgi:hypothetical protein